MSKSANHYKNIIIEKKEHGVILIKMNRPKVLNALNTEVLEELTLLFTEMSQDQSVRAVVFTGEGKAFIAGADISEMKDKTQAEGEKFSELGQKLSILIEKADFPVIAAVNGFALGGGTEMAIACDFIYASEKAVFGQPEVGLGIIPGYGATVRLAKFVGVPRAIEMVTSGRMLKAKEARRWGLVNKVCDEDELLKESLELAYKIALNSKPAVSASKRLVYEFSGHEQLVGDLKTEAKEFSKFFGTHDQKEGMSAFVEKRKPTFEGLSNES